jgi:hypothetical protein
MLGLRIEPSTPTTFPASSIAAWPKTITSLPTW